jgi:hypothetical protein
MEILVKISNVLNDLLQLPMYEDSIRYIMLIGIIIVATATTIFVNYFSIAHKMKVEVITERTKEFIKDTREYFTPLTTAAGKLSAASKLSLEANPGTPRVDELCFYQLCKYVNEVDRTAQVGLYCRKLTDEAEIDGNFKLLTTLIKQVLYKNEPDIVYNILKYFRDHSEYLSFKKDLSKSNEYKIFKENFNDQIAKDLSEYSYNLAKNLEKAITDGYKPWHRHQCLGGNKSKRIDKRYEKRVRDLRKKWQKV